VARNDLSLYSRYADDWWNPNAPAFRSLRAVSQYRLELILKWLGSLSEKSVLDVGAGGGLLSAPIADRAAQVVGVDLSVKSLVSGTKQSARIRPVVADGTLLPFPCNSFDVVVLADVLEHIRNWPEAVTEGSRVLRPGGALFVHTLNRSTTSYLGAIVFGEKLTGLIPNGTHDWRLFIRPRELIECAKLNELVLAELQGELPKVWKTVWRRAIHLRPSRSTAVSYAALFRKSEEA
jgi:2-polyprenyl-6-hydroxyphenyl methylase/3-demethylubiquinone-9 3-methyltransferase